MFPDIGRLKNDHQINMFDPGLIQEQIVELSYDDVTCNDYHHGDFSYIPKSARDSLISTSQLAGEISRLSECFGIDAGMFASLIYQESNFCYFGGKNTEQNRRLNYLKWRSSHTGAKGLTMFTSSALREIDHQLFTRDTGYFHYQARPVLHQYMAACGYARPFDQSVSYLKNRLWETDPIYMSHRVASTSELGKPKRWKTQLLYGAVLLKTLLSEREKSGKGGFSVLANSALYYRDALRNYNNSKYEKEKYWKNIFCLYREFYYPAWESLTTMQVGQNPSQCEDNLEYIQLRKEAKRE
jgi:hypothetical protein